MISIVGLSPSTRHLIDWSGEVWGLPWDYEYSSRCDRLFEMHDRSLLETEGSGRDAEYWERLRAAQVPVYMHRHWPDIPKSIPYPLEELKQTVFKGFPRRDQDDWYNSSPAYMIALAIHEGAEKIGLYGIDVLDDSEYNLESNCLDYLIGYAAAKGVEVIIPEGPTALCKFRGEGIKLGQLQPTYHKRYGYINAA